MQRGFIRSKTFDCKLIVKKLNFYFKKIQAIMIWIFYGMLIFINSVSAPPAIVLPYHHLQKPENLRFRLHR